MYWDAIVCVFANSKGNNNRNVIIKLKIDKKSILNCLYVNLCDKNSLSNIINTEAKHSDISNEAIENFIWLIINSDTIILGIF